MKSFKNFIKEQEVNRDFKTSTQDYKRAQTRYTNRVVNDKNTEGNIASDFAKDDMPPKERISVNRDQEINTQARTAPQGSTDAKTNKPYVAPKAEQIPIRGPVVKGIANPEGKGDLARPASPIKTDTNKKTTTVTRVPSPI